MIDEVTLDKHLGIEIKDISKNTYEPNQPHLVERSIKCVELQETDKHKRATPTGKPFVFKDKKDVPRKKEYNCREVVGMLIYLQGSTRPGMSMTMHQCARFSTIQH